MLKTCPEWRYWHREQGRLTGSRLVSFSTDNPGKAEGWHEPPRLPGEIVNNPFDSEGYALRRFDFNGTPQDPSLYENSRAEAYFKLADLVRLGRVSLPDDDVLREELAFCRYDVESSPLKQAANSSSRISGRVLLVTLTV
jgi:hypothetical protein